jgi:hypothetical protein
MKAFDLQARRKMPDVVSRLLVINLLEAVTSLGKDVRLAAPYLETHNPSLSAFTPEVTLPVVAPVRSEGGFSWGRGAPSPCSMLHPDI